LDPKLSGVGEQGLHSSPGLVHSTAKKGEGRSCVAVTSDGSEKLSLSVGLLWKSVRASLQCSLRGGKPAAGQAKGDFSGKSPWTYNGRGPRGLRRVFLDACISQRRRRKKTHPKKRVQEDDDRTDQAPKDWGTNETGAKFSKRPWLGKIAIAKERPAQTTEGPQAGQDDPGPKETHCRRSSRAAGNVTSSRRGMGRSPEAFKGSKKR